jgi:hypothetical protein
MSISVMWKYYEPNYRAKSNTSFATNNFAGCCSLGKIIYYWDSGSVHEIVSIARGLLYKDLSLASHFMSLYFCYHHNYLFNLTELLIFFNLSPNSRNSFALVKVGVF